MTEEEIQRAGNRPEDLVPPPDRPRGAEGRTTAREQRDGGSLDQRLAEEQRESRPEQNNEISAEEAAMHEVDEDAAPGLTDGPDRYVDDG